MTQRDYEKVANVLRLLNVQTVVATEGVMVGLARLFKDDNSRFHAVTFFLACGLEHDKAVALASELVTDTRSWQERYDAIANKFCGPGGPLEHRPEGAR